MEFVAADDIVFGPYRLSVRQRTLSGAEGPIALSGRAFDVLVALIESRAQIISKDDLMSRVWGSVVVEENNLHVQIAAIRRVFGPGNRYILTIPGRGYRFAADLESAPGQPHAPAHDPEPAQTNLPTQMTALVGRKDELAGVCALIETARLVTLVGPGGVGKTKLALAVAHSLLERYPEGCWITELGSISDPALAPDAVAASLRMEEQHGRALAESLASVLRNRQVLLVLDSCEHLIEAVADLVALLLQRCPRLRVICTSQTPLGLQGEHVRRIGPFDLPVLHGPITAEAALQLDAVRLFVERAGASDDRFAVTDASAASIVEICRSLDGIPLAIELAAARAPLLGLEPLRLRIANRLALLGDDRRDTPGRHRTLRAAIAWSYGLLPEPERQILRRLSIFSGGFTLAAAQQVAAGAGFAEWDIVRGIGALMQRSLLTTGPDLVRPRHRMLEALRDFLHEELGAGEERQAADRRHAQYFLDLAGEADANWESSGDVDWLTPFELERDNLRAALGWALGPQGDALLGVRLAAATGRFWFEAGHLTEGRDWLARALAQTPTETDPHTLISLKRGFADVSRDPVAAVAAAEEARDLAVQQGDPALEGVCLRALSSALYRLGRYADAEQTAFDAFQRLGAGDNGRSLANCVSDLCILKGVAGDYAAARRYNTEAQARLNALGDARGAAICLQYAAEFEFAAGHVDLAVSLAEESVELLRALNRRFLLEVGLGNLAAYRLLMDDLAGAEMAAREALTIAREIEDEPGVVFAIEHIALVFAQSGLADLAAGLYGYVEETHRRLGLIRQQTEETVHERLMHALAQAMSAEQRISLQEEGRVCGVDAAIAMVDRRRLQNRPMNQPTLRALTN